MSGTERTATASISASEAESKSAPPRTPSRRMRHAFSQLPHYGMLLATARTDSGVWCYQAGVRRKGARHVRGYVATAATEVRYRHTLCRYEVPGTDLACAATRCPVLTVGCYEMPGSDPSRFGTRREEEAHRKSVAKLQAEVVKELMEREVLVPQSLSSYARPMPCPVLAESRCAIRPSVLRACCALSGTEIGQNTTRPVILRVFLVLIPASALWSYALAMRWYRHTHDILSLTPLPTGTVHGVDALAVRMRDSHERESYQQAIRRLLAQRKAVRAVRLLGKMKQEYYQDDAELQAEIESEIKQLKGVSPEQLRKVTDAYLDEDSPMETPGGSIKGATPAVQVHFVPRARRIVFDSAPCVCCYVPTRSLVLRSCMVLAAYGPCYAMPRTEIAYALYRDS
eukprot:627572-Rhodomonas_salina.1